MNIFGTIRLLGSRLLLESQCSTEIQISRTLAKCKSKKKDPCGKKKKEDKCGKKDPVKGKVAIVTGGATGIGFSIARLLLACGAKGVMLNGMQEDLGRKAVCKLTKEFGGRKVAFVKCDVSKSEQLKLTFKCTKSHFKVEQPDIVVNNAGILQDEKWRETVKINCEALLEGCLLGFCEMGTHKGRKGGIIINVASIVGLQKFAGSPVYGASKHFVIGITRNFGDPFYYDQSKVKVLALCPGVTETGIVSNAKKHGLRQFKGCGDLTDKDLKALPGQPADACGCSVIQMLKDGENGSIWVAEDSETYKVQLPERCELKKKDSGKDGKGKNGKKCKKGKKSDKCKKSKKSDKCNKGKKGNKGKGKCGKGKGKKKKRSACGGGKKKGGRGKSGGKCGKRGGSKKNKCGKKAEKKEDKCKPKDECD